MAHKKGQGTSTNGRESHSKRLGVKKFGGSPSLAATFSSASAGPSFIPDAMSALAATGPFSP